MSFNTTTNGHYRKLWERIYALREYFHAARQATDKLKLQDLVAHILHEYLDKADQLTDWGNAA